MERFSLKGRVAMVTGGARGIGRAIADGLMAAGARVAVLDLPDTALASKSAASGNERYFRTDITKEAEVDAAVAGTLAAWDRIDILVNNAGINVLKPAEDFTLEEWHRVLGVNLTGAFICAQRAGRAMIERKIKGRIINIASVLGHVGPSAHRAVAYSAAKSGLLGMTRALAVEWARYGILVNAICPALIETELTRARLADKDYVGKLLGRTALHEIGSPEDIADAVVFLASPAAGRITGHALNVDSGWMAA